MSALAAFAADSTSDYPSRPIRVIVPNAAGASVDVLKRILMARLGPVLGQPLITDNRAGERYQ
jgi:tripartite-type tricarboxylate transporter receptor subunit TctC